ncbi:MAG: bifunctional metallophosphatase/5'-nucleotidase, partial [Myxococcales bacterium]|nr:bifunctional metallophosphatase/5'-nucleotidase [Myxococcales bacterium]
MFDVLRRAVASRAALGLALLLFLASCAASRRFVVFHTSDVHGGIEARAAKWHADNPSRLIGGQAALGALMAKEAGPKLLVDSGDIYQGTPIGNLTRGAAVVAGMNALGYDAMAVGNHEYDYGEENVASLAKIAQFPFLGANIRKRADGEPPDYVDRSVIVEVGGVKVGLIGIATRHTATSTLPKNVEALNFEEEVATAKREAELLREKGAEVIIALSHCGLAPSVARKRVAARDLVLNAADEAYGGDLAIARGADVDLVLGGHLHTGLAGTFRDPVSGKVIVQSYESLEAVSRITIAVDEDGDVDASSELIDLWVDQHGQDPAVKSIVDSFGTSINAELDRVIGTLAEDLRRADGGLDSALGNFFADALREAGKADVGIQNTFGIRADLYTGNLTQRDIYRVMPFENTLTVVDMPGV